MDCLFCRIVAGEIPADIVFSDDSVIAFRDISPVAPTHLIVIPRQHFSDVAELTSAAGELSAHLLSVMAQLGAQEPTDGFRLVFNSGPDAGQTVHHVHGHVLAGRSLTWPPG